MKIPVWVITGLLDSGKTTLINRLLDGELAGQDILVLQFEEGDVALKESSQLRRMTFSKRQLEDGALMLADSILSVVREHKPDFVLIEWNGLEHFHRLEAMLLQFAAAAVLSIEKVVYTAEGAALGAHILNAGTAAFSQIAASDCAYVRTRGLRHSRRSMEVLRSLNPDIQIYSDRDWQRFVRAFFLPGLKPRHWFLLLLTAVMLGLAALSVLVAGARSPGRYISVFLGVFLQAAPFLAIGVLLSSLIQVYLKPDWIQRKFPRKILPAQLFAVFAGFCLPVCDCASIPVFKSLVKKGVPMPAAVTFMLVSPVINPVVMLSTWYAFNGNYKMILARCGLGVLCGVLCGLSYLVKQPTNYLAEGSLPVQLGCEDYGLPAPKDTASGRFALMLRHAQNEFFAVGKFLLTGILVSTLFQDFIPRAVAAGGAGAPWKALPLLMLLAFVLSLCSSSDAVVARSMAASLPVGAVLGFLVFGPMMDIKNVAMLLSGFKAGFVIRLLLTSFVVCLLAVGLFMAGGSGGIRI